MKQIILVFLIVSWFEAFPRIHADEIHRISAGKNEAWIVDVYARWIDSPAAQELTSLVRSLAEKHLLHEKPDAPPDHHAWPAYPVGVFVTAMKGRSVRACVGTFSPSANTLSQEIAYQCKRLVTKDPRHTPLDLTELEQLTFIITFAGTPHSVSDPRQVDIFKDGLLAEYNGRTAVLLPGEAKTLEWGISFLHKQLAIPANQLPRYASFPVVVLKEERKCS
ncbi:MAG: AMMECR1 domain-containing protein [Candidatus Omnitrophota bacterium]|jgi:AMMECR1 domain-containing protein|nr:MAG: AMMECR1 domain-containing protein [Candidatus Omnitrophota bacterium]